MKGRREDIKKGGEREGRRGEESEQGGERERKERKRKEKGHTPPIGNKTESESDKSLACVHGPTRADAHCCRPRESQ